MWFNGPKNKNIMQNIAILDTEQNVQYNEFLIKSLAKNGFNVVYNNSDYRELSLLSNNISLDIIILGDLYRFDDMNYSLSMLFEDIRSEIWIVSTGNSEEGNVKKYLNRKMNAIVEKNNIKELLLGIENCISGRKYFSPIFHTSLYSIVCNKKAGILYDGQQNSEATNEVSLSEPAYQVLQGLAEGWKYIEIASRLNMSLDSVRYYVKEIYKSMQVNNKGDAIGRFLRKEVVIALRRRSYKDKRALV